MTDRASDNMAETLPGQPDVEAVLSASRMLYEEVAGQALPGGLSVPPGGLSAPDGTGRDWYTLPEAMLRGVSAGISSAGADLAAAIHTAAAEMAGAVQAFSAQTRLSGSMGDAVSERSVPWAADPVAAHIQEAAAAERAWHSAANVAPQAAESGRTVIQYITLRSDDETPYETARAIRRESEALLRV